MDLAYVPKHRALVFCGFYKITHKLDSWSTVSLSWSIPTTIQNPFPESIAKPIQGGLESRVAGSALVRGKHFRSGRKSRRLAPVCPLQPFAAGIFRTSFSLPEGEKVGAGRGRANRRLVVAPSTWLKKFDWDGFSGKELESQVFWDPWIACWKNLKETYPMLNFKPFKLKHNKGSKQIIKSLTHSY